MGITLEGSISNTVFVNIGSQAGRTSFSCESLLLNRLQVCSCLVPCLSTFSSLPSPCFLLPHEAYGWSPLLVLSCTCNLFLKEAGRCSFPTLGLETDLRGGRKESSANTSVFLFFFPLCVVAWQRQRWEEQHSGVKVSRVLQIFMVLVRPSNDLCTMGIKWNESDVRNRFLLFHSWTQGTLFSLAQRNAWSCVQYL